MGDLVVMNGASELERLRDFERHVAIRIENNQPELDELERQFVEDDLHIQTGPKVGQPLTAKGRRQRLSKLLHFYEKTWEMQQELEVLRDRRERVEREERDRKRAERESEYDDDGWSS